MITAGTGATHARPSFRDLLLEGAAMSPSPFHADNEDEQVIPMPEPPLSDEERSRVILGFRNASAQLSGISTRPHLHVEVAEDHDVQLALFGQSDGEPRVFFRQAQLHAIVREAWRSMARRVPEDHVLCHPLLAREFLARCRALGATSDADVINRAFLNARKAGRFADWARERVPSLDRVTLDRIALACELGGRYVQLKSGRAARSMPTVDRILCDPALCQQYDQSASRLLKTPVSIDPIEQTYLLRLGLLRFRKIGSSRTIAIGEERLPRACLTESLSRFDPEHAPNAPGIFEVSSESAFVFVGHSSNLRSCLRSHWDAAGDGFVPPEWELHALPGLRVSIRAAEAAWTHHKLAGVATRRKLQLVPQLNLCGVAA